MKTAIIVCLRWHVVLLGLAILIPPCLAQDFDVTVDRAPDYRARWPLPTTETYRVRQVGPGYYPSYYPSRYSGYSGGGYYGPSAGPAFYYDIRPTAYVSPITNPQAFVPQPGIVLNTRQHDRVARKAAQRKMLEAALEEHVRLHGEPTERRR